MAKRSKPRKRKAKSVTDVTPGDITPPGTLEANVGEADLPHPLEGDMPQGDVFTSRVFGGTVKSESATVSETPGKLSEEDVDVRKEVRSPFSPLPKDDLGPVEIEAEAIAGARADADWQRAAAETPILRGTPDGASVGRTILTHRQEILGTGPGIKATIDEILVWYDENPPNDPDTQRFVEQLGTLSTGLDTYLAMLQGEPTETEAEAVGSSLFEKALSAIKAFEETYTGNKIIRVSTCVAILGIASIAAPMLAPWITVPLMGAYVFPEETKVATGLFTALKDLAKKYGFPLLKSDEQKKS